MDIIKIPHNWQPRAYQLPLWSYLEKGGTRATVAWHRRAGKDEVALHWACVAAHKRPATYWHMLPEAAQARKAIWQAINPHTGKRRIDEVFPLSIRENTNETEMFIRFKSGSTWQVLGSDNFNSLVGSPPAGVVGSEWALANPLAWAYLRPILAENNGWAVFISTPRGRNHFHKMLTGAQDDPASFSQILTVEDTSVFKPGTLESELREFQHEYGEDNGKSLFMQEYYCSFDAAIVGSVYGAWIEKAEREKRICQVQYDPMLPVYTAWDLGRRDHTCIWFYQIAHNEIRLIDYHQSFGKDVPYYCEIVKAKPYKYGKHYVPRDGAATHLLAAGGRSFIQQAHALGITMFAVAETTHLNRHSATRKTLPVCWFDRTKTEQGVEALRNYRFKWDDKKMAFGDEPYHDGFSDGATAFEIIGRVWQNPAVVQEDEKPKFLHDLTADDVFFPKDESAYTRERY